MPTRKSLAARSEARSRRGFNLIDIGTWVSGFTSGDFASTGGWLFSQLRYIKNPSRTRNPAPPAIAIWVFENCISHSKSSPEFGPEQVTSVTLDRLYLRTMLRRRPHSQRDWGNAEVPLDGSKVQLRRSDIT